MYQSFGCLHEAFSFFFLEEKGMVMDMGKMKM